MPTKLISQFKTSKKLIKCFDFKDFLSKSTLIDHFLIICLAYHRLVYLVYLWLAYLAYHWLV